MSLESSGGLPLHEWYYRSEGVVHTILDGKLNIKDLANEGCITVDGQVKRFNIDMIHTLIGYELLTGTYLHAKQILEYISENSISLKNVTQGFWYMVQRCKSTVNSFDDPATPSSGFAKCP